MRMHSVQSPRPPETVTLGGAIVEIWLAAERTTLVRRLTRYRMPPVRPTLNRRKFYRRRTRKFTF